MTKDAIIISDLHLGSKTCEAKAICSFLKSIESIDTRQLILNGDVLDSLDCRRLKKSHWEVLSQIRRMSDKMAVVWVRGNHDGPADILSNLLGVEVMDEHSFHTGGKTCLVLHGDHFDSWIYRHPMLTWASDVAYGMLQRIDASQALARSAKRSSKTFMRISGAVREGAVRYAVKQRAAIVCCGHTHFAEEYDDKAHNVFYANSGCWTEKHCHYLTVKNGQVKLKLYEA